MLCPECRSETSIVDTLKSDAQTLRKHKCISCAKIFSTVERIEEDVRFIRPRTDRPNVGTRIYAACAHDWSGGLTCKKCGQPRVG